MPGAWGVGDMSYGFVMVSDFKVSNFWQIVGRKVVLELKCTAWKNPADDMKYLEFRLFMTIPLCKM